MIAITEYKMVYKDRITGDNAVIRKVGDRGYAVLDGDTEFMISAKELKAKYEFKTKLKSRPNSLNIMSKTKRKKKLSVVDKYIEERDRSGMGFNY